MKKLTLFAQIEPNENLIELNKRKQKFIRQLKLIQISLTRVKAYLVGLAVTDSPASLGTDMLQFAANAEVNPLESKNSIKTTCLQLQLKPIWILKKLQNPKFSVLA